LSLWLLIMQNPFEGKGSEAPYMCCCSICGCSIWLECDIDGMSDCIIKLEGAGMEVVMLVTLAILTMVEGKNCSSGEESSSNDARPCSSPFRSSSLKLVCGWPS
jgi:hypothetical protein